MDWPAFLADYHRRHPAITEDLLGPMRGAGGLSPYEWLVEGAPRKGLVWDLACGSGPVADVVGPSRYLGVDLSPAELSQARSRRPLAQVEQGDVLKAVAPAGVQVVTVAMALMLLGLEALLDRLVDVLPSQGLLLALLPDREAASGTYGHLLALLGQAGAGYRTPLAREGLAARFAAHRFTLIADELLVFSRALEDDAAVDLVLDSFYAQGASAQARQQARAWLGARVVAGDRALAYPLRRLRARRV